MGSTNSQKLPGGTGTARSSSSNAASGVRDTASRPTASRSTARLPRAATRRPVTPATHLDGGGRVLRDSLSAGGLRLTAPVGPAAPNRPRDVYQVESVLNGSGLLGRAPGTAFGADTEAAIRTGQQRLNRDHMQVIGTAPLKVDGLINPEGPTQTATRGLARQVADQWHGFEQRRNPPHPKPQPVANDQARPHIPTPSDPTAKQNTSSHPSLMETVRQMQGNMSAEQAAENYRLASGLIRAGTGAVGSPVVGDMALAIKEHGARGIADYLMVRDAVASRTTADEARALDFALMRRLDPKSRQAIKSATDFRPLYPDRDKKFLQLTPITAEQLFNKNDRWFADEQNTDGQALPSLDFSGENLQALEAAVNKSFKGFFRVFGDEAFARKKAISDLEKRWGIYVRSDGSTVIRDQNGLSRLGDAIRQRYNIGVEDVELADIGLAQLMGTATEHQLMRAKEIENNGYFNPDDEWSLIDLISSAVEAVPNTIDNVEKSTTATTEGAVVGGAIGLSMAPIVGLATPISGAIGSIRGAVIGYKVGSTLREVQKAVGHAYIGMQKIKDRDGKPLDEMVAKGGAILTGVISGAVIAVGADIVFSKIPGAKNGVEKLVQTKLVKLLENKIVKNAVINFSDTVLHSKILKDGLTGALQELTQLAITEIVKIVSTGEFGKLTAEELILRIASSAKKSVKQSIFLPEDQTKIAHSSPPK